MSFSPEDPSLLTVSDHYLNQVLFWFELLPTGEWQHIDQQPNLNLVAPTYYIVSLLYECGHQSDQTMLNTRAVLSLIKLIDKPIRVSSSLSYGLLKAYELTKLGGMIKRKKRRRK